MNNRSSFQLLLDHAEVMIIDGQKYERLPAMAEARVQYNGGLTLLNWLADGKPADSHRMDILRERVHGLLANVCYRKREFEQAASHLEEQLALHAKLFGASALGLVDIYVSLSNTYLTRQNKISEARAAAEKAFEIVTENGSQASASAIFVNYYICLCERSVGNKAAAAVAIKRAVVMLDANPSILSLVEANVIRALAGEFA